MIHDIQKTGVSIRETDNRIFGLQLHEASEWIRQSKPDPDSVIFQALKGAQRRWVGGQETKQGVFPSGEK